MDKGGKFIAQQMSMVDMQLQELITAGHDRVREAFGISKTILGQNEDVNRATALAAESIYGRYTLADRVDLWTETANELLRRYPSAGAVTGRRPKFRVELEADLTPEDVETAAVDRDSKVAAVVALSAIGADAEELAEAFGLPAVTWPDPEPLDGPEIEAPDDGSEQTPRELAEMIQKVYLGVDKVVTWDEARDLLRTGGMPLPENVDQPATPAPTAFGAGAIEPGEDDDDSEDPGSGPDSD